MEIVPVLFGKLIQTSHVKIWSSQFSLSLPVACLTAVGHFCLVNFLHQIGGCNSYHWPFGGLKMGFLVQSMS